MAELNWWLLLNCSWTGFPPTIKLKQARLSRVTLEIIFDQHKFEESIQNVFNSLDHLKTFWTFKTSFCIFLPPANPNIFWLQNVCNHPKCWTEVLQVLWVETAVHECIREEETAVWSWRASWGYKAELSAFW